MDPFTFHQMMDAEKQHNDVVAPKRDDEIVWVERPPVKGKKSAFRLVGTKRQRQRGLKQLKNR